MKDLFSSNSSNYAKFRPKYPPEFYNYLFNLVRTKENAWDCGTGNGQVAIEISKAFKKVYATDISSSQLANAFQAPNIQYSVQAAEETNFQNQQFNLIIIAQAIHWFNFESFYKEIYRCAKPDAYVCVLGYGKLNITPELDEIINQFYEEVLGNYWDKERRYIDENYLTIPFPFDEIECPHFAHHLQWDLNHLMGYLNTWSAVKNYIQKNKHNPLEDLYPKLQEHWQLEEVKKVSFPLLLRIGKLKKERLNLSI